MFDRVDVDVINMTLEIDFVTNRMFPISSLPDPSLASSCTTGRNAFTDRDTSRERRLDQSPSRGEIRITVGQRPHRVDMIGQYDHRVHGERMVLARQAKGRAQFVDVIGRLPRCKALTAMPTTVPPESAP